MQPLDSKLQKVCPEEMIDKQLVRGLKEQFNLPTYVLEYIIAKYQSQKDISEIKEELSRKLFSRQESLQVQKKIRQQGTFTLIDKVIGQASKKQDDYQAQLMNLQVDQVDLPNQLVEEYPQLLAEGGLWSEIKLEYQSASNKKASQFTITELTPCQRVDCKLDDFKDKASQFTQFQWRCLLLRSLGLEPLNLSSRQQLLLLSRLLPLVEKNYNFIELGPRCTGKSYLYRQLSDQSILVSGGRTTVANLFYNMGTKEVGLVGNWDVVAFDEVAYVDFKDKTAIQILKDYMESGIFSRGREEISAEASMVFLGNINSDLRTLLNNSNLFEPLPNLMRDMALIDRFDFYLPGWELDKLQEDNFTDHYGLPSGYLSLIYSKLRKLDFTSAVDDYFILDDRMDVRDKKAVHKTVSGYLKLLHPTGDFTQADVQSYLELALEGRKRVKEQLAKIGSFEYQQISFEYTSRDSQEKYCPTLPEIESSSGFRRNLAEPGVVYVGQIIEQDFALLKLEIKAASGQGRLKFATKDISRGLKQDIRKTFLFIKRSNSKLSNLINDYNFQVKVTPILKEIKADISNPFFLAIYSLLNNKSIPNGLLVTEESSLYRKPDNNQQIKAIKLSGASGQVKTLLPLAEEVFVEVPSRVIEQVPVFTEV